MKFSKKIMGGVALAGVMALTGIIGFAQQQTTQGQDGQQGRAEQKERRGGRRGGGDRGMRGGFPGRFMKNLNLTEAQQEQMKQIAARYRESTKALRQQERGERGDGSGLFTDGTFNESAVRARAQARANARVELEVAHARMMSEMYAVLTQEQKTQLANERKQWEQKRQERRARRGASTEQDQ